jgi:hypothetical protein
MTDSQVPFEYNDLDRSIWEQELDAMVPQRVFDVHTHVYRWQFSMSPTGDRGPEYELFGRHFAEANWAMLDSCDRQLMPGREIHRLAFPMPFSPTCDFESSNWFVADEAKADGRSAALMLVHPSMTAEHIETQLCATGCLGFKPHACYSRTGAEVSSRITDFLPEHQIEVAHRHDLLIMLHLSKRDGIADPENVADLKYLTTKYCHAKWILAHCARSYSARAIERSATELRGLPTSGTTLPPYARPRRSRPLWPRRGPTRSCTGATTFLRACCAESTSLSAAPGPSFRSATTPSTCCTATRA